MAFKQQGKLSKRSGSTVNSDKIGFQKFGQVHFRRKNGCQNVKYLYVNNANSGFPKESNFKVKINFDRKNTVNPDVLPSKF